jgi:hypothetical protein
MNSSSTADLTPAARACDWAAKSLARLQNGRIQNYFRVMSLGAAILLLIYFFT